MGDAPVWTLDQERKMEEKILNNRFDFFMVLVTVVITVSLASRTHLQARISLGGGFLCTALFYYSLYHNYARLTYILRRLEADPAHPLGLLKAELGPARRGAVLVIIPTLCLMMLAVANFFAWLSPLRDFAAR
jgi:hypothetical protein